MKSLIREMDERYKSLEEAGNGNQNHLGVKELNYIEVSVRDARLALELYADIARNYKNIVLYGSNVYASNNSTELSDLLHIFDQQAIEISSEHIEDDLDEQNVTGAIAGYSTPNAFRKKVKRVNYATGLEESVNTPATYKIGEHQRPESSEEEFNDKFPFSYDDNDWFNTKFTYPAVDMSNTPGTATANDNTMRTGNLPQTSKSKQSGKHTLKVEDVLEKKYEQLIEGYRDFKTGDIKPSVKVKTTIQEIAKKLQEIETLIKYNSKLKTESGVTSDSYGPATKKALTKISERLLKISERVRSLGE